MTNERMTPDQDAASDEYVTTAYRDLANERAPDELNAAVLRNAAKAARPPYQRSILWTRPVAWAAVIAICLAITLQITQVPVPEDAPAVRQLQESAVVDDVPDKNEPAAYRDKPVPGDMPAGKSAVDSNAEGRIAPPGRSVDSADAPESPAEAVLEKAAPALAEDFEMQDADMLRRAEDMVRLQAGANKAREVKEHDQDERENVAASTSGFAAAVAPARLDASSCSDKARQNPEDWLDCILALEDAGLLDAAALQREQLKEAFPDFEIPAHTE